MKLKFDELDKALLRMLQENADLPQKQIAAKLNRSVSTISERKKKLRKLGVIKKITAHLDRRLLGLETEGYLNLRLADYSEHTLKTFRLEVSEIKEVRDCISITGTNNIMIQIVTTDLTSFSRIERTIGTLKNVKEIRNYINLENIISDRGFHF